MYRKKRDSEKSSVIYIAIFVRSFKQRGNSMEFNPHLQCPHCLKPASEQQGAFFCEYGHLYQSAQSLSLKDYTNLVVTLIEDLLENDVGDPEVLKESVRDVYPFLPPITFVGSFTGNTEIPDYHFKGMMIVVESFNWLVPFSESSPVVSIGQVYFVKDGSRL